MPSAAKPRTTRRHLTLQQKVLIIDKREREGLKQDELAQWAAAEFGLPSAPTQPTISNILKDKDKLRDALRANPQRHVKSVRDVTCPEFEEVIVQWINAPSESQARPDRRMILEFAAEKKGSFPRAKDLALSEGWLSRMLERRGISLRNGKEGDGGDMEGEAHEEEVEAEQEEKTRPKPGSQDAWLTRARPAGVVATATVASSLSASSDAAASPAYAGSPHHHPVSGQSTQIVSSPRPTPSRVHVPTPAGANTTGGLYERVQAFYGSHLRSTQDLQTNAASSSLSSPHPVINGIFNCIPDQVMAKYYGCGLPIPLGIDGLDVLDLGCGGGRDAFALSALVGPEGTVTGVDMAPELLAIAKQNVAAFTHALRISRSSLHFVNGYIEHLARVGIENESIDIVTSNLALSLSPDKKRVLQEVRRVLRTGGEFYFSDLYASRRVPDLVRESEILYNEGLGGAMYVEDFKALSHAVGFGEPRLVSFTPVTIRDEHLATTVSSTQFYSVTYRCFKVPNLEMRAAEEDYGHVVKYLGTIVGHEAVYELDLTYRFEARRPVRVGGNTAIVLKFSWLAKHFYVDGDWSEHFGRFTPSPANATSPSLFNAGVTGMPRTCAGL